MAEVDHEVVIVGAGISGLTAAWALRHRDVVLIEAADRVGGRIRSVARGDRWVNLGAHLVSQGQVVHELAQSFGVPLTVPTGLKGTAVAWGNQIVRAPRPEYLPFRLPMSVLGRASLVRAGIRLKLAHPRAVRADSCGLLGSHVEPPVLPADESLDRKTFRALVGPLHPEASGLIRIIANRAAAEPGQVSAHYLSMTSMSSGEATRFNVVGGTEQLVQAMAAQLGNRVRTATTVDAVTPTDDGVELTVRTPAGEERLSARTCLVTVPAPIARQIVRGLPPEKEAALRAIPYGSYVVAGFFTKGREALPWADRYMVLAPDRSFCLLFNSANASPGGGHAQGSNFTVYVGGDRATAMLGLSDTAIVDAFLGDLYSVAPLLRSTVEEVVVQRWPHGNPITAPGRSRLQPLVAASVGRVHFAGDYVGHPGMDSAAAGALHAVRRIEQQLEAGPGNSARTTEGRQ